MTAATAIAPTNGRATVEAPPTRNLWQRIAAVQAEVENIEKAGKAPEVMGGYAFVRDVDVYAAARKLFAKHGIAYTVSMTDYSTEQEGTTKAGNPIFRSTVTLLIRLRNVDDPSQVEEIPWTGCGDDTADKGLQKAATSAAKYALMKALLIGGDDPDGAQVGDGASDRRPGSAVAPEDDYGLCDEPGCAGRLVAKVAGKNKTRMVECSEHGYMGKDGKRRGGACTRETDWSPDWSWYEAHRNRGLDNVTGLPGDGAPTDGELRDSAVRRLADLSRINADGAKVVCGTHGWDGAKKSTEWIASLRRPELLTLLSDINGAIADAPSAIPFGGPA